MKKFTFLTKILKFTGVTLSTIFIVSCGNIGYGTSSQSNFGNLQSVSTTEMATYPVAMLQGAVTSFVCPGTLSTDAPSLCAANKNYIESSALSSTFGQFNLDSGVINNGAGITSVNAYKIVYTTSSVPNVLTGLSDTQNVSGAILVPNIPENQIKGIILY